MLQRKNIVVVVSLLNLHHMQAAARNPVVHALPVRHAQVMQESQTEEPDLDIDFGDFDEICAQEPEQPAATGLSVELQRLIERFGVQLFLGWLYVTQKFEDLVHGSR